MEIRDRVVVVTGAASGIGEALVERFAADGARAVVVADRDAQGVAEVAGRMGGTPVACDVTDEAAVKDLIDSTVAAHGAIDLLVSNAGYVTVGGLEAPDDELRRMFDVHVMAHLYAARHAIPHMAAAGGG
mgnify:CR=1 FL=1